ncbi:hypothetical protein [Actinopolyspora halophila]|uniref:hypothetical protein n=1 Tax=Actinopolyspora halophila TaxID=1850 RepID=UPI00037A040B|nr:hypothetical protein [Actinopolyspora halophila]
MTTTEPPRLEQSPEGGDQQPQKRAATNGKKPAATSDVALADVPNPDELEAERIRLRKATEVADDDIFVEARSQAERKADRKLAERQRRKARRQRKRAGSRQIARDAREQKAQDRIDAQSRRQRVYLAKAQRKRAEMTDSGKALAATYRNYTAIRSALSLTTLVGITWTSYNVGSGLSGSNPLYYAIEPLFSVPLVVIAFMQMVAALYGRLNQVAPTTRNHRGRLRPSKVGWIELSLLVATTTLGITPSIVDAANGGGFSWMLLGVRLAAPTLVVISVGVQYIAAELFGDIIRNAWMDGDDDSDNVRDRVRKANSLVKQVQASMAAGDLPLGEDGMPSITTIQKRFTCEKLTAQCAHDALPLFHDIEGK